MTSTSSPPRRAFQASDNLALLYQGVITNIVRVRSGSHPIKNCDDFQKRVIEVLSSVEREAIRAGYPEKEVRDANYAVVAFLDEAVFDSKDPNRQYWTSLQSKLYGQSVAGESFFDQLKELAKKRDSPQLADILEVYYLCLLLGYQGRYGGYAQEQRGELRQIMDDLRARIEGVRGSAIKLSVEAPPPPAAPAIEKKSDALRIAAVAAVVALAVIWIIFRLALTWMASGVQSTVAN